MGDKFDRWSVGYVFLALQLPSIRAFAKYFPLPEFSILTFLIFSLLGTLLVMRPLPRLVKAFDRGWPTISVLAAFMVAAMFVYPYADALKLHGAGSDADDALILAGNAIIDFRNPYSERTYLGNALTPGPGWILLVAPFSASGWYMLFSPCAFAMAVACFRWTGYDWRLVNQFFLLVVSSLLIWEIVVAGSDYVAAGLLILSATLLLQNPRLHATSLAGLVLLIGLLSSFRSVYILLPLLVAFSLLANYPMRAVAVALGGLLITISSHAFFLFLTPYSYPPFELLQGKVISEFKPQTLAIAAAICCVVAFSMLAHWRTWRPITHLAVGLATPWSIVAFIELINNAVALSEWTGASYLALPQLFIVFAVLTADGAEPWARPVTPAKGRDTVESKGLVLGCALHEMDGKMLRAKSRW